MLYVDYLQLNKLHCNLIHAQPCTCQSHWIVKNLESQQKTLERDTGVYMLASSGVLRPLWPQGMLCGMLFG